MMIHTFRLLARTVALATSVFVAEASGAELKVLSAGAMRAALQELAPAFEAASGNKLKIEYSTAGDIEKKVAAGDEIDVAILTKPRVDKLASEAKIVGGSSQTLARAQIGLAVKKGAAKPDISSVEAFKKAVLNAKSVAYADPASGATSGQYLANSFEKLGISTEPKPKTRLSAASRRLALYTAAAVWTLSGHSARRAAGRRARWHLCQDARIMGRVLPSLKGWMAVSCLVFHSFSTQRAPSQYL